MYIPLEKILSAELAQWPELTIGELQLEPLFHRLMTIKGKCKTNLNNVAK